MRTVLLCVFMLLGLSGASMAQLGSREFAATLSLGGRLDHARGGYSGPEVIYRQSGGVATEAAAMAQWQTSPRHASLIRSGAITEIVCSGRSCVGRGPSQATMTRTVHRHRWLHR